MSLRLALGTKPEGLEIKTWGAGSETISLGDYEISMEDFFIATEYILTNTDLKLNDPRLQFLRCVRSMRIIKGFNPGGKRLVASVPAVLLKESSED